MRYLAINLIFFFLSAIQVINAQTWFSRYPNVSTNSIESIDITSEGNYIIQSRFSAGNSNKITKVDQLGGYIAHNETEFNEYHTFGKFIQLPNDEARFHGAWANQDLFEVKVSKELNLTWVGKHRMPYGDFLVFPNGNIVSASLNGYRMDVVMVNPNFDTLWQKSTNISIGNSYFNYSYVTLKLLSNGNFLLYGDLRTTTWPNSNTTFARYFEELSPDGTVARSFQPEKIRPGGYYGGDLFEVNGETIFFENGYFERIAYNGSITQSGYFSTIFNINVLDLAQTSDGNFLVLGNYITYQQTPSITNYFTKLIKTTPNFDVIWEQTYEYGSIPTELYKVKECGDKGFLLAGTQNASLYLQKTDSLGGTSNRKITGLTYLDANNNCAFDQGEQTVANQLLKLDHFPAYYSNTDSNGIFQFGFIQGHSAINLVLPPYFKTCPDTVWTDASTGGDTLKIGIQNAVDCPLLRVSIGNPALRPCFDGIYNIQCCNEGSVTAENASLDVRLDTLLTFMDAEPAGTYTVDGSHILFSLGDVGVNECKQVKINFKVNCGAQLGTMVCTDVSAKPDSLCLPDSLLNFENDIPFKKQICRVVTGSFDPNDKQVFPSGTGDLHLIPRDTLLEYLVRFQNTGTDTAFTVVIRDTLPDKLDPATLKIGVGSHPFTWDLNGRNLLTFTFDNILLPDSFINEKASHGYIQFSIRCKNDVKAGDKIANKAGIYFDFNLPVLTNTALVTIDHTRSYQYLDTVFCSNIPYLGRFYEADTLISTSVTYTDNIVETRHRLDVLPAFELEKDTTLHIGDLFLGQTITNSHTNIEEPHSTVEGCDSIIVWKINVLSSTINPATYSLEVVPNPASNEVSILTDLIENELYFELYNATGVLVKSGSVKPANTIDISQTQSGVYFVKIKAKNGFEKWVKLVKK